MQHGHVLQYCGTVIRDNDFSLRGLNLMGRELSVRKESYFAIAHTILSIPLGPSDVLTASPIAMELIQNAAIRCQSRTRITFCC